MQKNFILAIVALFIFSTPAFSSDLCLIDINSHRQLELVMATVPTAHGRIDGKFIVQLNDEQRRQLETGGISVEFIKKDVDPAGLYILTEINKAVVKMPLTFESVYSSHDSYLIEADRSQLDIYRKSGYMAIAVGKMETPFFYHSPSVSTVFPASFPGDSIADMVVQDSLYSYNTRLEDFYTRYVHTDSLVRARDWLIGKFQEFGYTTVYTDTFYYYSTPCHNVICIKEGSVEPDKLIVIGGHYDSYNTDTDPMIFAPGADDNGSGTTTVLELARIFKDVDTRKTIMFVAFSAEEVGLVGSWYLASNLYYSGADVDYMANFDMVAYTEDEYDDVAIYTGAVTGTYDVFAEAAQRVTSLIPYFAGAASNSDHASFDYFGYLVAYGQEGDFNYPGWHHDLDITSRLDFPYFEQFVKMSAAALMQIDKAAHLTPITEVWDVGDGQSLRLVWGACDGDYSYSILSGTVPGVYTDTANVPPSTCTYDLTGLTTGQTYYFAVRGENEEGYGPIHLLEESGTPYLIPKAPANVKIDLDLMQIILVWQTNMELDLSHYQILRRPSGGDWSILVNNVTDTAFDDFSAGAHTEYEYIILAVDTDMNESDSSEVVRATPASFDLPLLFADETASGGALNPSEAEQAALYGSLFSAWNYDTVSVTGSQLLSRSLSGQYRNIFWFDDDISTQLLSASLDSVEWYLGFNNNFCLAGWQTIYWLTGPSPMSSGDIMYDEFGIQQVTENGNFDFIGADGQNGWPNLEARTDHVFGGLMPNISIFETRSGAEVIYTFNSDAQDPDFQGEPCGVIYETTNGKRVALSFPIFQLTEESSHALVTKIGQYFAIGTSYKLGDANNDGMTNIFDITFLVAYLYKGGPPPPILNAGDVNGDCEINIFDPTYLIAYLYLEGPQLLSGCVD